MILSQETQEEDVSFILDIAKYDVMFYCLIYFELMFLFLEAINVPSDTVLLSHFTDDELEAQRCSNCSS